MLEAEQEPAPLPGTAGRPRVATREPGHRHARTSAACTTSTRGPRPRSRPTWSSRRPTCTTSRRPCCCPSCRPTPSVLGRRRRRPERPAALPGRRAASCPSSSTTRCSSRRTGRRLRQDLRASSSAPSADPRPGPSLYVCKPSATDAGVAPEGHENLFVLVPLPADPRIGHGGVDGDGDALVEQIADAVIAQIAELGRHPRPRRRASCVRRTVGPADFVDDLNAWRGTALGPAHTLAQSAFFRAGNVEHEGRRALLRRRLDDPGHRPADVPDQRRARAQAPARRHQHGEPLRRAACGGSAGD